MPNLIPSLVVRDLLISGVKFSYESYNHKEALAEIEALKAAQQSIPYQANNMFEFENSCWGIPNDIKKNHIVWRTGRVSEIHFAPNGEVRKVKIGKYYYKTFYLHDFGVRVKPILFKTEDKYDLIKQGLAVEDKI